MSVQPVRWVGVCDHCGLYAPEMRDSAEEAQQDADDCPCGSEAERSREEGVGLSAADAARASEGSSDPTSVPSPPVPFDIEGPSPSGGHNEAVS